MNSSITYKADLSQSRGIELSILLLALFGFWEFTLSSWPFQSHEFDDLWPGLQGKEGLNNFLVALNTFASANSRLLEIIPTLIAEVCFISYALGRTRLFIAFGSVAIMIFAAALHFTNFTHPNHPYYDFLMLAVIVLAPGCLQSIRVAYALTYFMCALLKINAGWITGSFFLTANGYLPFAPAGSIPYLTNMMIIFQMFGCFLLLSRNPKTRKIAASLFILFHLYSVIIAGSRFSWSTFPFLVLLYMTTQDSDLQTVSKWPSIQVFFRELLNDVKTALQNTKPLAAVVISVFMLLQGLSYLNVISEKRTFNMFSEATACVITVAGPDLFRQYGHPIGSGACFKDQIVDLAKREFCSTAEDFDLRLEVSKNAGNYRVEHEQLSVCKNQVDSNSLPPITVKPKYKAQNFIHPARTSEKVDVAVSADGTYELKPSLTSQLHKEFWLAAKLKEDPARDLPDVESLGVKIYQYLLLFAWLTSSAFLFNGFYKKIFK